MNPGSKDRPSCTRGDGGARVWGHPVRNLELFAWHWLASAITRAPEQSEKLRDLMYRLEEATARLAVPETAAVGWISPATPDADVVDALDKIVAVLRALAPLVDRNDAVR